MADFRIKMGILDGVLVTEALLTKEVETFLTEDGDEVDLWPCSTALVDNSILLDEMEAQFRAKGFGVVRGCNESRISTAATYEWLCIGLLAPAKCLPPWNEDDFQPSEADCLSAMFADEMGRMHP